MFPPKTLAHKGLNLNFPKGYLPSFVKSLQMNFANENLFYFNSNLFDLVP